MEAEKQSMSMVLWGWDCCSVESLPDMHMAQRLISMATPPKDPGLNPSTPLLAHKHMKLHPSLRNYSSKNKLFKVYLGTVLKCLISVQFYLSLFLYCEFINSIFIEELMFWYC